MRDDEGYSPLDRALEDLYDEDCMDVAHYLMSRGCACGDEDKARLLCAACSLAHVHLNSSLPFIRPRLSHTHLTL